MKNKALIYDEQAKSLAKTFLKTEAELLLLLMTMKREGVFPILNYLGIFDYCERALNLSRSQSYYFKSVAEKSETVPELKDAVVAGRISLSQARRIEPVVTQSNVLEWIEKAKTLVQPELEREVQAVNPKARKKDRVIAVSKELTELRITVDRETEQNLKKLQDELSQKLKKAASLSDVVTFLAKPKAVSSRKSKVTPKPGRHVVPMPLKREVYQEQNSQCTYVSQDGRRCTQNRWLNLHHVKEVREGGLNTKENLRLLCFNHHKLIHTGFPLPPIGASGPQNELRTQS